MLELMVSYVGIVLRLLDSYVLSLLDYSYVLSLLDSYVGIDRFICWNCAFDEIRLLDSYVGIVLSLLDSYVLSLLNLYIGTVLRLTCSYESLLQAFCVCSVCACSLFNWCCILSNAH